MSITKMPPPYLESGSYYGYGNDGVRHCRGSIMGRSNRIPDSMNDQRADVKMQLRKLELVDVDYDKGGAYWGWTSVPMWCAWGGINDPDDESQAEAVIFTRAQSRDEAKSIVRESFPNARFFR